MLHHSKYPPSQKQVVIERGLKQVMKYLQRKFLTKKTFN